MAGPAGSSTSFKSLLQKKNIRIPDYQRDYDWRKSHIEGLIEDLAEHVATHDHIDSNPYFLGNLMIHQDTQDKDIFWYLVDGQQRMVSLTILAGYIRDKLIENEDYKLAFDLQIELISEDYEGTKRRFIPKSTNDKNSPDRMLWPIQSPPNAEIEFKLKEDYDEGEYPKDKFNLEKPIEVKFPISTKKYQVDTNIHLEIESEPSLGEQADHFYGKLICDGDYKKEVDVLKLEFEGRQNIIDDELKGTWNKKYLIYQHFNKNLPESLENHLKAKNSKEKTKILLKWKKLLTQMHFTTTVFTNESDAIFYFGKLNDADTKLQLNSGDLLAHLLALVREGSPKEEAENNKAIETSWNNIKTNLKEGKEKQVDEIPSFLDSWLIAKGQKTSKRKIYTVLKSEINEFKDSGGYDKKGVKKWIKELYNASDYYKLIVFSDEESDYTIRMDCIERLGKQHRGLFLAGFLGFEKFSDKKSMERLLDIWEFMKIKGEQIPALCEGAGVNIGRLKSNDIYGYLKKWCTEIYLAGEGFTKKIGGQKAQSILNSIESDVKNICDKIWSAAEDISWDGNVIGEKLATMKISQNTAKVFLTRLEINESSGNKSWSTNMEVEHIAPKKFSLDWVNEKLGGGFKKEHYQKDSKGKWQWAPDTIWIENLGNRTLLAPGSNGSLQNKNFHHKQNDPENGYKAQASDWHVTEDLASDDLKIWGPKKLEARSKRLLIELISIYDDTFTSHKTKK